MTDPKEGTPPETYFAIGFFPDRPCGAFMEDFDEETGKPGARARRAFVQAEEILKGGAP